MTRAVMRERITHSARTRRQPVLCFGEDAAPPAATAGCAQFAEIVQCGGATHVGFAFSRDSTGRHDRARAREWLAALDDFRNWLIREAA